MRDIVRPAIDGTLTVLRVATASPQVRHVNVTSSGVALQSICAMMDPRTREAPLTEDSWNDMTADYPGLKDNPFAAYTVSKTPAERAAFDFVREQKPHWTLATFCPPYLVGPAAIKPKSQAECGSTWVSSTALCRVRHRPSPSTAASSTSETSHWRFVWRWRSCCGSPRGFCCPQAG